MSSASQFREQFSRPSDIMSVLLLLGGEIVHRALAQLSGLSFTPVAFSFGWATYAVTSLLSAVSGNTLLPPADTQCLVINGASETAFLQENDKIGLTVAVYRASARKPQGVPDRDWLWYSGVACGILQLGVAAIPWRLWGDWSIFLTTACGILLATAAGPLPQWKAEKWACRKQSKKTMVLTPGNGTNYCIVVRGDGVGLDLEDLAGGRGVDQRQTRVWNCVMAVLWVGLLIAVSGLKENPWFLLVAGIIGMLQNLVVCGLPRTPGAFGVQLEFEDVIVERKVMDTLKTLEERYPNVGRSLLEAFFPGGLRADEEECWKKAELKTQQGASGRGPLILLPER